MSYWEEKRNSTTRITDFFVLTKDMYMILLLHLDEDLDDDLLQDAIEMLIDEWVNVINLK